MLEKMIRGWRVRAEGPGYVVFFDPRVENVVLYDGPDLAYELRERREAGEAGASSSQCAADCGTPPQFAFEGVGYDRSKGDRI